ncbi:protein FATTY ACID EXPORT 4, chloroplastic [Fagus crenata]
MPHSSSHLLLITAPATGCFHEHHHLKCGAVALNWSKSYKYASSFVSAAARVGNSKSSSRCLIRCDYQLADLAPATSATYGLLLLGGGLFAYTKSGSKGSLFGGLTGVALMASAYFLMEVLHTKAIGDAVGFGSSFLFSSVFAIRLAATRKLTPAGPLFGVSVCALAIFISAYLHDRL